MTGVEITAAIQKKFPDLDVEWVEPENGDQYLYVPANQVHAVALFLRDDWDLGFDYMVNLSCWDTKEHLEVTYHLYSYKHRHSFILKVKVARENATVESLCGVYGAANFQEREVFDHFGIKFNNHPDLRRILLPDDWVGHPLLKDYKEEEEYRGIGTTRPSMLK